MSEDEARFAQEMKGVTPLKAQNKAELNSSQQADPGMERRRLAAIETALDTDNFLSTEHAPELGPHDIISFVRPGVQHGVFHKLRRGRYEPEATLDLHRNTVEEARRELWDFVQQGVRYQLRTVMVLHGKGDRSPRAAVLKSFVAQWLKDMPQVLAYHSALPYQGGAGAVYVLLKKSPEASEANRERFLHKRPDHRD